MSLENGNQASEEFQDGITPLEAIDKIEELLYYPTDSKLDKSRGELACYNCGYTGYPSISLYNKGTKIKRFPICPICGDKTWVSLVNLIRDIRNIVNEINPEYFD